MTEELKKALIASSLELLESLDYKVFSKDQVLDKMQEAWEDGACNGDEWYVGRYMKTIEL